ncbi:thioredoxin fold domain-containing protein [Chryseobacterium sp. GMJ5]|uniref:Thioredoxin fold domain-containing protein n=1 Tax=Chryseobacterium gilvum TaxID=2976534 RepID=A0ABT2VSS7_9FLAO|nr:thioredoxin fold domain-containing protein [Chryseobacterium gilvum]MCU7613036.1 thioredoxin fold domain-containing protein [Chryseobacterium gilvum]
MKNLILFSLLIPCFYLSQFKTVTFSDLEIVQKDHPKPVIIHLYTDWCSVCKIEKYNLSRDKDWTERINKDFYFINFEAEKTKNEIHFQGKEFKYLPNGNSGIHELALALSKNKNQPVYPLWIILDKKQNLVYYHEGQFTPKQMKETLAKITGDSGQQPQELSQ